MEELMMRALVLLVLGLRLVMRELVVPVLALAMVCSGMTWGASGGGRGEVAGCCAAAIQPEGLGKVLTADTGDGWFRHAGGSPLEGMKVVQLRQLARMRGLRALARSGRRADLLEALGA
jgi:hypothetical protein